MQEFSPHSVLVWKGTGYDAKKNEGWIGHVATVVNITSQKELDEYRGTFLGFGEIGKDAILYDTTFDK